MTATQVVHESGTHKTYQLCHSEGKHVSSTKLATCAVIVGLAIIALGAVPNVYAALPSNTYFYLSGSPTRGTSSTACGTTWGTLSTSTNAGSPVSLSGSSTTNGFYCFAPASGTTYSFSTSTDSGQYTFQFVWSGSGWAGSTVTVTIWVSSTRTTKGTTALGSGTLTVPSGSGGSQPIPINVANGGGGGCTSSCYLQFGIKSSAGTSTSVTMAISGTTNSWLIGPPVYEMDYAVIGGGSGYTAPTLTYTKAGSGGQTLVLTTSAQAVYIDPGTTYSVTNPLSGSTSSERWSTTSASGTSAIGGSASTITFTYYNQYLQTLSYSITGTPAGSGYSAPSYTAKQFGASTPQTLTTSATGYWYDAGSSWSVTPNPLSGSTSSEQWYTTSTLSGTVSSAATLPFPYANQYSLTMIISPSGGGTTTPTGSVSPGASTWETAGASFSISATQGTGYVFSGWVGSGTGSYTGSTNPYTFSSGIGAAITETADFNSQVTMTVSYSVTGGGSGYTAPWFNYVSGGVAQHYQLTTTGVGESVDSGSTWTVSQTSGGSSSTLLGGSGSSEQWVTSQSVTGTASAGTTVFTYQNQYTLTFTMNGHGSPSPASGTWENSGVVVRVTIGADGSNSSTTRYVVNTITGSGSGSYSTSTSGTTQFSVTMSAPITETVTWTTQYMLTFAVSPVGGGTTSPSGTAYYSAGSLSISATPGSSYSFSSWSSSTGSITFGSSTSVSTTATIGGTGTITANFVVVTIRVDNRTLSASSGGGNMTAPQNVNPTVEYWYGAGVYDSQYATDIQSVTIDLYRTGHTAGSFDKSFVYSFRWVANGWGGTPSCSTSPGCWQELQSSGWVAASFNYLVSSDCSVTTISASIPTAKWQFAVKLDQLAVYTTNGAGLWNFKVTVVGKSSGNPSGARAGTVDVNLLISITVPGNMGWGTVAAGSVNVTASGMPVYTTYTANAIVSITLYGGGNPVNQYGDSFPLSYVYVGQTSNPAKNDGVVVSTSPKVFYSSLPVAANSNLPMYGFISTPNPFTPGSYTFTYYEAIQLQSMQP